ncbi:hypothetical protein GCG54_00004003 [Colletotrichum gloeosporioides]|uniref:Uncharacterized protein n=1 Tax=Colletotrichum gloeosporioides TaxID=474922 RepID=A0A8H4C6M3_COLGL|nr:uncharacterized protein GCG54_00004003 [Colletotrichum gloeosporioides]KAF3798098.1 hypothetical protein GCG54_00004003 [Colletotrichum gloeosporioides]
MAREGTRSQTGNSKPRVFPVIDTAPVRKPRSSTTTTTAADKPKKSTSATSAAAKPVGITKKKAATTKKEPTVAQKAKSVAKSVSTKVGGATKAGKKETKPKTAKAKANALEPVAS